MTPTGVLVLGVLLLITSLALVRRGLREDTALSRVSVAMSALAALLAGVYAITIRSFLSVPRLLVIALVGLVALGAVIDLIDVISQRRERSGANN